MAKKEDGFSELSIRKILMKAGAKKVSKEAIMVLKNHMEKLTDQASSIAIKLTNKNDKKRVTVENVEVAFDIIRRRT